MCLHLIAKLDLDVAVVECSNLTVLNIYVKVACGGIWMHVRGIFLKPTCILCFLLRPEGHNLSL